jgi:hexokinase
MASPSAEYTQAQNAAVNEIVNKFTVDADCLKKVCDQFVTEMQKGLDHEGAQGKKDTSVYFLGYN